MSKTNYLVLNYRTFNIFILPILMFFLTYMVYGFYFETNDDFVMSLLLKGDLQPDGGFYDLSYFFYRYLVYTYSFLYNFFPAFPWYGISLIFFNFVTAINIFYILESSLSGHLNKFAVTAFLITIFVILIAENIIDINFTRTTIILAGSTFLLLTGFFIDKKQLLQKKYIIVISIFFIIALLIRPMAGILTLFVMLPFVVFKGLKSSQVKSSLFYLASFYVLALSIYISTQYFRPNNEMELIEYGSKLANISDFDYDVTENKLSMEDSVKKEAVKYSFIADKQNINKEFLDRISSLHYISFNKFSIPRIKTAIIYTAYYIYRDYPGISVLYIFILITVISSYFKKSKFDILYILIAQLIFFMYIISIHIFMKLPDRIFLPLYGIVIVCNIILIKFSVFNYKNKSIILYSIVIIILSFVLSLYPANLRYDALKLLNTENNECFSSLEKKYKNTTFLITQPSSILFDGHNSLKNFSFNNNKIFPLIGWTTLMPSYYLEIKKMCNSVNINDLFNYLKNKPDYLLISNDKFNGLLTTYFKLLYNNEINFIQVSETPDILKKRNLYLYFIKN